MTTDIQKQYDRHDDFTWIILRMKDVYAVPDRHVRYAATKVIFGTKMTGDALWKSMGSRYYHMNRLEKSIYELINMLVQYEATTKNSPPSMLVGEAVTSKPKGKGARRWKGKKGKMTKKPFIGQSELANDLLDLIHSDVYRPLNTQARGGFSYFITFVDDHSWYCYVYLMRYKFEAFGRFKEFRLDVKNQTGHKMKTLRLDRGDEYLSGNS
ncbi:UNVERIFIED_CONTAM: hypothetical protein Scaly_0071500 [Sesamum calycinum]|uniref:Integrase catalytic domain-containing protein n=1 Tax=Sesamum calycinum TaxID=2727403 RepID=A0AAW2SUF1_9LAMI